MDTTSSHYKGKYRNIYAVHEAYPNGGAVGDYVDIAGFAHYWNEDRGTWCVNENRDNYWDERFSDLDQSVENLEAKDTELEGKITAEATARQTADTTLQTNIDSEATERAKADTAEATARQTADEELQTALDETAETVLFGGFVDEVTVETVGIATEIEPKDVLFCKSLGKFVGRVVTTTSLVTTIKWYDTFGNSDDYWDTEKGQVANKIFLDISVEDKQDELIAGDNITIASDGKTISAKGMTDEEKEKLDKAVVNGENDESVDIQAYTASLVNLNGKGFIVDDSDGANIVGREVYLNGDDITDIVTKIASKQDKLTAGDNITISADNVISATGGGSGDTILERNATTASGAQRKNLDSTDTGFNATATGKNATSFGGTASGQYSFSEGSAANQAIGLNSHAEGASSKASGSQSHAEGEQTTAEGDNSHAEGYQATASGSYSHAEGMGTSSSGFRSHAEGYSTKSSGYQSHAEGTFAESSGHNSHAEGEITSSKGNSSHAEGSNTQATNYSEHAEGYYNASNNPDSTTSWKGDGTHTQSSIGIGSSSKRKNAQEVMQNGDQYIYGIGGYDGTNATSDDSKTLQTMVNNVQPVVVICVGTDEVGKYLVPQNINATLVGTTIQNGGKAYFAIKETAEATTSTYVEITKCIVGVGSYSFIAYKDGKQYTFDWNDEEGGQQRGYVFITKDVARTELETAVLVVASTDLVQDSTAYANKSCIKVTETSSSGFTIIPSGGDFPYGAIIIDDGTPVMYTSDDAITIDDTTTWADLKNALTASGKTTELTDIKKVTELSQSLGKISDLETDDKTSVVNATNELKELIGEGFAKAEGSFSEAFSADFNSSSDSDITKEITKLKAKMSTFTLDGDTLYITTN